MEIEKIINYMNILNDGIRDDVIEDINAVSSNSLDCALSDIDIVSEKLRILNILDSLRDKFYSKNLKKQEITETLIKYRSMMRELKKLEKIELESSNFTL